VKMCIHMILVYAVGQGIHEMGTARMGRDPKTSVLNGQQSGLEAPKCFHHRWSLHDILILCESFINLYGHDS
jgi:hypothetical protein